MRNLYALGIIASLLLLIAWLEGHHSFVIISLLMCLMVIFIFWYSKFTTKIPKNTQPVSEKLKQHIHAKQEGRCAWPGCEYQAPKEYMQLHHLKQRSRGGSNDHENLAYLCPNHHTQAHREEL